MAAVADQANARGFGVLRALLHDDDAAVALLRSLPRAVVHACDESSELDARVDLHIEVA